MTRLCLPMPILVGVCHASGRSWLVLSIMGLDLRAAQWVVCLPSVRDGLYLIPNNPKLTWWHIPVMPGQRRWPKEKNQNFKVIFIGSVTPA